MKKIQVQAKLGPAFAIEVAAGDHQLYIDQPKAGGGTDTGPSPLEYLFAALAGCVGSIGRIVANQQRLAVRGMDIHVEGELDPAVLLGRSTGTRSVSSGTCSPVMGCGRVRPPQRVTGAPHASRSGSSWA